MNTPPAPPTPRSADRLLPSLLLAAILGGALWYAAKGPPRPVPATAPDTAFSAERAMVHVRAIAARPHPMGTAEHDRVRDYLIGQFEALGLTPEVQRTTAIGTRFAEAGRVENILARRPGTASGGAAVLLVAHYDGVGASPAAGDDASGTAVVLETMRALSAGPPLTHDVIALITDGEEAGLLGAAAFVREHPWAKDVEMILNFEARGTGGPAVMFQTGPDNLDQIRVLRTMPDVAATSLAVTVYQFLPNDTDLSEFFILDKPGLNFAFADGVERYHTSQDDVAHLDSGSIQQEGSQALGLTRVFAAGPLPRPATGNAVFFDVPLLGLVYYPERWARPIAVVALALVGWATVVVIRRERRWALGLVLGVVGLVLTMAAGGGLAYLFGRGAAPPLGGRGPRELYALGVTAASLGVTGLWWALVRRWVTASPLGLAALLVWTALAAVASWQLPGLSFVAAWPVIVVAIATGLGGAARPAWLGQVAHRAPAAITLVLLAPVLYGMGLVALGVAGPGGIAIGALVPLVAWLLAADWDLVAGNRRWLAALTALGVGVALVGWGRRAARHDAGYPIRSLVAYAEDPDLPGGWLMTAAAYATPGSWNATALGAGATRVAADSTAAPNGPPQWLTQLTGGRSPVMAAPVAQIGLEPPTATVIADSTTAAGRQVEYRILAGAGAVSIGIRVLGAEVIAAALDDRMVDPSRYRYRTPEWGISFGAPPDSGFRLRLTVPAGGAAPTLDMVTQRAGLPAGAGLAIPARPANVVPSQTGDMSLVHRVVRHAAGPPP
ncbi:MAG: M28 family peptidase [Gemmatimonadales bacterium]